MLGVLWNQDVGISAFGDRGPGLWADPKSSGHAPELDDRQMLPPVLKRDDEFEPDAGLAFDGKLGKLGTLPIFR